MPIRFKCQDCRSRVKVPEGSQGKQVKCPRCGRIQSVPRHNSHGRNNQPQGDLTVHTMVGSMHQSPKRKEALVTQGSNGRNHEYRNGGGAPGGLDIPPIKEPDTSQAVESKVEPKLDQTWSPSPETGSGTCSRLLTARRRSPRNRTQRPPRNQKYA